MYTVTTIVTPIEFFSHGTHAVTAYNLSTKDGLGELDVKILAALSTALRGYPAMQLRTDVQDEKKIFSAVFNRGVNRLIALGYITRAKHSKWIYYTITMRGRNALSQLNDHLVSIVQDQMSKLK